MGKKMRNELLIGAASGGLYILLDRFAATAPDALLGALLGIGICFGIIGLLPDSIYHKLKNWKKRKISLLSK